MPKSPSACRIKGGWLDMNCAVYGGGSMMFVHGIDGRAGIDIKLDSAYRRV